MNYDFKLGPFKYQSTGEIESTCYSYLINIIINGCNIYILYNNLYYSLYDKTCVNTQIEKLNINFSNYLLFEITLTLFCTCRNIIVLMNNNQNNNIEKILYNSEPIDKIATIVMLTNIFGAVLFFGYVMNNNCSDEVYRYLFFTIIFRLVYSIKQFINASIFNMIKLSKQN